MEKRNKKDSIEKYVNILIYESGNIEEISATILDISGPPNITSRISWEFIITVSLYSIESTSKILNSM